MIINKHKNLAEFTESVKNDLVTQFQIKDQKLIEYIENKLSELVKETVNAANIEYDIENKYAGAEWGRGWESAMKWVDGHLDKFINNKKVVNRKFFY